MENTITYEEHRIDFDRRLKSSTNITLLQIYGRNDAAAWNYEVVDGGLVYIFGEKLEPAAAFELWKSKLGIPAVRCTVTAREIIDGQYVWRDLQRIDRKPRQSMLAEAIIQAVRAESVFLLREKLGKRDDSGVMINIEHIVNDNGFEHTEELEHEGKIVSSASVREVGHRGGTREITIVIS